MAAVFWSQALFITRDDTDESEWRSLTVCSLLWAHFYCPAKLLAVYLHMFVFFHSYLNKYCFATRKHNVTSNLPRVSLKMKMKYAILWRLLPLIVLESATSECTIIRPGHPNGSESLSLAVLRSVHWTSKDQKNKVKKFSGCFRISLKSPVRTRPVWI